jgi:glycosyltransferase involved in cell wall biosynthesis
MTRDGAIDRTAPDQPLRLAVVTRSRDALSLGHFREYTVRELAALGVTCVPVREGTAPPSDCGVLWDPALAGTRGPQRVPRLSPRLPVVATAHGAAAFVLPWRHVWPTRARALGSQIRKWQARAAWRWFGKRADAIVAQSDYGVREVSRAFMLPPGKVQRIYPGVSPIFRPDGDRQDGARPYFLAVGQYSRRKNFEGVLAAYSRLPRADRPDLVVISPGWRGGSIGIEGVQLFSKPLQPHEKLAHWYRGATALVFPSFHETFGFPIVEAMACGCPVITSDVTACPEIAGDAALRVNPHSVAEITEAMCRIQDAELRGMLRARGLGRARQFSWRATAEQYLELFFDVLARASRD